MKVWIAVISHRFGVNTYAAASEEVLRGLVYGFVKDYWEEVSNDDEPLTTDQQTAIDDYFRNHLSDFLECFEETEVVGS